MQRHQGGACGAVVAPRLQRERTLAGRGHERLGVEDGAGLLGPSQPLEAGVGEHECIRLAGRELAEAGVDVAAERDDLEVLTCGQQERAPAQAPGAHPCAGGKDLHRRRAAQGVARVGAGRHRDDLQTLRQLAGDVLGGMHRHVRLAVEQHALERGHPA